VKASNPDSRAETFPQNNSYSVFTHVDRPPFSDIRVRRALHLAIDRQAMVSTITFGQGIINPPGLNGARKGGWTLPQDGLLKLPGYRQPKTQDLAEAKRLLAEAGHPNGLRAKLSYNTSITQSPALAEVLTNQLGAAGINLTLQPMEDASYRKLET